MPTCFLRVLAELVNKQASRVSEIAETAGQTGRRKFRKSDHAYKCFVSTP